MSIGQRTGEHAVRYDAPVFTVEQSLRDPRREAEELAARRRDAGYDEGFRQGWEAASDEVAAAIADHRSSAERLERCAVALEAAMHRFEARDAELLTTIEADVVELAVALATEIVGHELATVDDPVVDALARVAELVPERGTPRLRVHPDDADTAREAVDADLVRWTCDVEIVADPSVERGGCVVDVGACRIDGQVGAALDRMRSVLG